MRKREYILTIVIFALSNCAFACSCGWGEYFYPVSELEGEPIDTKSFYIDNYKVSNLMTLESEETKVSIKDENGLLIVKFPVSDSLYSKEIHMILESNVSIENTPGTPFQKKALIERVIFEPSSKINEISTRFKLRGESYNFYIIALEENGRIKRLEIKKGKDHCAKPVYVKSKERAIELDAKRESGCYQFKKN